MHFLGGADAVTIAETQCARETDSRLLLAERGAHGANMSNSRSLLWGYLRETFAETRQVPCDYNDAAIKVDVLSPQR